jgi:hypothetical protein
MKWHGFFSFIVPPSLLVVFPELSLVLCGRADTMNKREEKDGGDE